MNGQHIQEGTKLWAAMGHYVGWRIAEAAGAPSMYGIVPLRFFDAKGKHTGNGQRHVRDLVRRNPELKGKDKPKPMGAIFKAREDWKAYEGMDPDAQETLILGHPAAGK